MPNWPEDPRQRNVYGDVYGQSLPMPGQTQQQGIPSLADLATLVNQQQPQQSGLPSPNFQQQQPSLSQIQPPLMPQAAMSADTPASNQPKPAGFGRTLLDLGGGIVETARGLPAVVASQLEGVVNPGLERDWKDRVIEENRKRQQADIQALRDSGEYSRPMGLGIPMTRGEWAETTQSFPYTAATMGPAILGGIAGSAIGGAIGGLGGPAAPATVPAGVTAGRAIGSTLGGMLGAYIPAGRSAANQFIRDSIDQYQTDFKEKNGREPSAEETGAYYQETIEPNAVRIYHGEAAPEAAGTVAELGLMKSAIGDILHGGGSLPVRAAKAAAKTALSAFVVEPGTETATQQIQQPAYAATGLTNEKPRSLSSVDDWLKSAGEVYKQAAATSLFFSALGIPAGSVYGRHLANQEGKARASDAEQATAELRTNLEFARESDIAEALSRFDEIENAGRLPKSAAQRIDAARQQLLGELSLRVSPESISAPMNSQRGMAGYLGFSERVNELDDAQLADLAGRVIPENAEPTLADAAKRYQAEIGRRQALTDSAAHFEQNPDAVAGVAKALDDIATGKPMSKSAHGSTSFNLASLSDDMLRRYQLAGEVLLRDHSEALGKQSTNVERSLSLLNEESQRRAEGQTRDPEAIREADLAERAATAIAKGKKPNIKGLSFETLDRMASGLEARASMEPRLADSARMLREAAQQGRLRAFNPQGQQQPGIQSAMRGWNSGQPEAPAQPIDFTQDRARLSELAQQADVTSRQRAILDQEAQRRATREQQRVARSQEIAALNQQNPPLATPQGLPTITPAAIPQSLGRLGQTRLGNGVDQLPIPVQPQPSTPNVTESQGQGRQETSPMGLPARPTGASQSQARGTPEQAASALLRQVPGRLGEQARLNHERVRPKSEWQAFGPDTGTLGIPRADMPQVKAEHRGALVNFLNARGVAHEQDEEVDPTTLKPTQAEFSPKKVQQANEYQGGNRSILVSSDGHVVDGHHQWLSALSKGTPIKAIRLDAPIADLLPLVKEFPSSTESKATTQPQPEQRREERQAEAAPLLSQEAEKRGNAKKPKAKGVAPTWNDAKEIERAAMISRSSEKSGAPVSNAFAQRKAVEWKTWADIPEGPAKKRLREYMTGIGKAENAPNRTESQGKESDKKADIKPSKKAAKQSPPPASKGASRNRAINATVDAGKDSLLTAIAKIGGLDRAEAQRQGIDLAEFKRMPVFGKPVFRKNGGKSFDAMAESLSEFGYPVLDEQGNYSPNVLLDAISRELAGNPVYTPQGIESAARRDAEEQAKFEQDNWLLDAIDLENAGFDALNDQEQVTAQLQADASRDLGEDAADTIFERISQQHEQATPEQFNEALRAAFNEARQRQSANSREQAGEPGSVQAAGAILQDYSIEELRAEEERIAKAQSEQEAKDKAAQQKTAADRARSDFVLTGSNRPADVAMARGQTNLLGAMEGRPKTRQSKPSAAPTNTIQQARAQLIAALNDRSVAALERSGKLILHRTDPTRTGAAGYVDPQGVIHLIPSNMDQDALSVALHEAMHLARDDRFSEGNRAHIRLAHAALKITGLKNFIGNPGFSNLTQQLHRLAAEGNKTAIEALDKARREAPGNVEDEAMAYMVQYADENLPLVRRIIAALRAALYRMGIKVKLTPADVRALALSALKARAKDAAMGRVGRMQPAFSQPTTETDAAEQDRLWQEFQAVRAQFQAKQASQSAFDRWFGKGVEGVNARNEKPLVLYHGTNNPEFNRWDESRSGQASQHPTAGLGFFMTSDKRSAARYGSRLLELHAKIDNPYYMTDADLVSIEDTQDAARFRRKLQAQGYDAAVISAPGGAPYVVALRSNQVKLASNENPTENEDFRYSRPGGRQSPPAANPLPAETMGQAALRAVQDRFIRFRVIQDWLKQHGVNLTPDADVYGAESLLPKVTAARTQDAREKILKPLIESAAGKKWSIQGGDLLAAIEDQHPFPTKFKPSIPEFLHAQHAIERNAQIAKIKGAPKDGSGLSDAQAHEILTRYRVMPNFSEFSAMAEKFRAITDQTRRILRTSGIISAEQEAAWTSAYKKYVPLKGGPDTASQQTGTGPGISVNPGMKRALGHRLRDENIVENIWRDHERALYLSEKQKVTRALRNMLEQANNQNIGTVGQPEKKATLHQGYYHQVWIDGNPLGAYGSYLEAKAAISSDAQQSGRPLSKYAVVHKPADPAVVFMSRPMLADNEVALYENGQRIRLQLNDELLARAARNLGVDGASGLLKAAQSFNRWLSHAYTGYNPEFIFANVARDMTTGMINLSGQYGGKFALKTLKGYGSAVRGLWKQIHGKADPWVDRYRAAGGSTGAAYLSDLERIGTDLKRIFQDYQGASETLRQGDRAGAARVAVSDKIRWLGGWIEKMNQVGENALRVATFRAMVEAGHSDAVAARAAGDVTVNFNRKGELTPTLGGLYLFFNPSIQGTKAMWDAMAKGAHRGQAMAMAGSLTLLALTLAELARGGDDADEEAWKRIPGYVKDRNLVIKMGDIQGTIPIPYGYGAFWSLGNILSDLSHGEDKTKAGIRFASSLFEQFSAIGNPFAGDEADIKNAVSLLPTALKPMMEIAMNRNSLGRPIMPEMSPWNTAQPDSARRWRSTTGSLYDGIASGLNRWTGGNAYQAGAIDISPETLSYLWRTFTGGAGKFAIDSMGLGTRIAQGVSPELREIPVLRKFVRAESIQDARTLFNEQSATVRLAVDAFNAAKRAKDLPAMRQMIDEQRQVLALGKVLQTAQKMIRARREFEDRINQSDLPLEEKRAQLKAVEKQESAILSRFTARFEKARQESR